MIWVIFVPTIYKCFLPVNSHHFFTMCIFVFSTYDWGPRSCQSWTSNTERVSGALCNNILSFGTVNGTCHWACIVCIRDWTSNGKLRKIQTHLKQKKHSKKPWTDQICNNERLEWLLSAHKLLHTAKELFNFICDKKVWVDFVPQIKVARRKAVCDPQCNV